MGRAWGLIAPYWRSEERWRARGLLGAIVALTLGGVGLLVLLNNWNREFYNALEQRDAGAFGQLLLQFCALAAVFIVGSVYRLFLTQQLEFRWRSWLTHRYLNSWLSGRAYYQMELQPADASKPDNPDQRIAEDLRYFTQGTLSLGLGPALLGGHPGQLHRHPVGRLRVPGVRGRRAGGEHPRLHGVGGHRLRRRRAAC